MNHNRWSSFSSHLISLDLIEFPHRTASGHAQPPLTNWTGDLRLGEYRSNPFPSPTFPHYFYTPFHPFPCILHFSSMPLLRCYLLRKLLFRTQTHTADRLHYLATKMNGKIRESKSIKSTDCSICPYIVKEFATYGTQPLKVQGGRDRRGRPDRQPLCPYCVYTGEVWTHRSGTAGIPRPGRNSLCQQNSTVHARGEI